MPRPPMREDLGVYFAPIRHHSPACARHVARLIDEVRPAHILIEAPADFEHLMPILDDPATRPPVAIVAFRRRAEAAVEAAVSYFPFCAHSPEFVALKRGRASGARVRFIDLPMEDRAMWAEPDGSDASLPEALTEERVFDSSDYVKALCERFACRDGNELWDHLFETRADGEDWRGFFTDTGAYCALVRESSTQSEAERRENAARETAMAAALADARAAGGTIVVVAGGFHTPALLDSLENAPAPWDSRENAPAPLGSLENTPAPLDSGDNGRKRGRKGRAPRACVDVASYVIRYGFEQLDRLNGYSAGLPSPAYYDRLWCALEAGARGPALWNGVAADALVAFGARLRAFRPALAVSVPGIAAALQNAAGLAELRGLPGPGREDLLDACRSTFVKGESRDDGDPTLAEFVRFLGGSAFGEIPPSAGSPPLVESLRALARGHGLRIDDGERRRRELDIYRNPKHRALSRFFHATALVRCGFAERTAGPDLASGAHPRHAQPAILFEQWSYGWSPMVEARLIDLAAGADTLEAAALSEIRRLIAVLEEEGLARRAAALVPILTTALQAGFGPCAGDLDAAISGALIQDGDFASVVSALRDLDMLWRARDALEYDDPQPLGWLVEDAFTRALFLLYEIANTGEAQLTASLEALASLRSIAEGAEDAVFTGEFRYAVGTLLRAELPPAVEGAVAAVAFLAGMREAGALVARLRGEIGGAYVAVGDRVAYLRGVLAISRELLWNVPELIDEADTILASLAEDEFLELLPHIRLAFAALDPRETDRVAERVAERHGAEALAIASPVAYGIDAETLRLNLELARELELVLETDGLGAWLRPVEEPT